LYAEIGSTFPIEQDFSTKRTTNCTCLSDDKIIAILLRLSKKYENHTHS